MVPNDTTTGTLQIDTVSSSSVFTSTVTGVTSNTGDITLSTAGPLSLNQQVSTGSSSSGTVRLQANGTIDQSASGVITALNLGVNTPVGDIELCLADNAVSGNFGAHGDDRWDSVPRFADIYAGRSDGPGGVPGGERFHDRGGGQISRWFPTGR